MSEITLPPEEPIDGQDCSIHFSAKRIWVDFHPALPNAPHKPTRTELMAAAALIGIARTLTGSGEAQVMAMLRQFDDSQARKKARR